MKYIIHITFIAIATLFIGCKNDKVTESTEKKPIVIKEVTFPEQNKVTAPPPNKPSELVDTGNQANALAAQQTNRDSNVRAFRQELRQSCLRSLKERPVLKFTVHKDGSISTFSFVKASNQKQPMEVDESIIKCTARIIKKAKLGPLDIEVSNKPLMDSIKMTIPV